MKQTGCHEVHARERSEKTGIRDEGRDTQVIGRKSERELNGVVMTERILTHRCMHED